MGETNLPKILKSHITILIDDIRSLVPENKATIWLAVKCFFTFMDEEKLIYHIINTVLPYKKQILSKDENFFLHEEGIFGELPKNEVLYVKDMVGKDGLLTQQEKDVIWNYFSLFVTIAEEYKKKK